MTKFIKVLHSAIKPHFIKADSEAFYRRFFSYTRLWGISMTLLASVSLIPLTILAVIDYKLTERSINQENVSRLVRVTSNTRRSVYFFFQERVAALKFIIQEEPYFRLSDSEKLAEVLKNLKIGFGGLLDLGVINSRGKQVAYSGPFDLEGKEYGDQLWFQSLSRGEVYISEVFQGYRNIPHIVIAVRSVSDNRRPYILRATLDTARLERLLASLEPGQEGDAFLVNKEGVLQTPSQSHGDVLDRVQLRVPRYSERTSHYKTKESRSGEDVLVGYAYIEDTPFVLFITRTLDDVMQNWTDLRMDLIGFFGVSILLILLVIYILSTYMINIIFETDIQQAKVMHHMEDTTRLASVGRLAAGVAHEINNPLAIIDMKAGLIKDMFVYKKAYQDDPRLMELINSIIVSVHRCGEITKQLLGFSREVQLNIQKIEPNKVVKEVLSFLEKEASYRNIDIRLELGDEVPPIRSDRGKLQQILLNIINNAFQAMQAGGGLTIATRVNSLGKVEITISDTGPGIPKDVLQKIFEPFFTTKKEAGGSGLGLSITYGLIRKLMGTIDVQSEEGAGTTFILTFPLSMREQGVQGEDLTG